MNLVEGGIPFRHVVEIDGRVEVEDSGVDAWKYSDRPNSELCVERIESCVPGAQGRTGRTRS